MSSGEQQGQEPRAGADTDAHTRASGTTDDTGADATTGPSAGPGADPYVGSDPYAATSRETTEGRVYTVTGGDWDQLLDDTRHDERVVINMGPQHPSTHGVLRLVLELEGEQVIQATSVIGYLHTGIEKNCEYRTWTQGVTFVTRADYLGPLHNEAAYCLATERLLDIEVPRRAQVLRVMLMEINRISSHLVALATGAMELGALTGMTSGFREREEALHLLEFLTGLRMNHAFIRPGGLAQDMPDGFETKVRDFIRVMDKRLPNYDKMLTVQPIWKQRLQGVGYLPVDGCLQLGVTGPILRSAGLEWDLRKVMPYSGYEEYDFEVPTSTDGDCYARYVLRVAEIHESLKIIEQCLDKLEPGPVMVDDPKIGWPAKLSVGADGIGNSLEHIRKIMGQSMESLIHHFKLVTEGFRVPAGQAYASVESPRGELGYHLVSDGGTRPLRVHVRDPSFVNLQSMPAMSEGGLVADVIAAVASLDPVMGGVDR